MRVLRACIGLGLVWCGTVALRRRGRRRRPIALVADSVAATGPAPELLPASPAPAPDAPGVAASVMMTRPALTLRLPWRPEHQAEQPTPVR